MSDRPSSLGRGLDSLFDEISTVQTPVHQTDHGFRKINMTDVEAETPPEPPAALAASVAEHGVLQPILVRSAGEGRYTVIDGHKRVAAARLAAHDQVPAIVMNTDDDGAAAIAEAANCVSGSPLPAAKPVQPKPIVHEDDLAQVPRTQVKWVYVATAAALLLLLGIDIHLRSQRSTSRDKPVPANDGTSTPGTAVDPEAAAPASSTPAIPVTPSPEPRPPLVGDIEPPDGLTPFRIPDDDTAVNPVAALEPDAVTATPATDGTATNAAADTSAATAGGETAAEPEEPEAIADVSGPRLPALDMAIEGVTVQPDGDGIRLVFDKPLFRFRTVLHPSASGRLQQVADRLKSHVPGLAITVIGHTDSDTMPPNAPYADNRELGMARAAQVAAHLYRQCGVPRTSLHLESFGEENPPYPNDTYDSRVRNRTVTLRLKATD